MQRTNATQPSPPAMPSLPPLPASPPLLPLSTESSRRYFSDIRHSMQLWQILDYTVAFLALFGPLLCCCVCLCSRCCWKRRRRLAEQPHTATRTPKKQRKKGAIEMARLERTHSSYKNFKGLDDAGGEDEWECHVDDNSNAPYWSNLRTGEARWEPPPGFTMVRPPSGFPS